MSKYNILMIDDNGELREIVRESLEMDGYAVLLAGTAKEALDILKMKKADSILLDLMLPDGAGLSLISKIRECTDAPVIVISGKGALVDKVVGLEMGADDYLGKPFELKELSARVKANVRRYHAKEKAPADAAKTQKRIRFGEWILDQAKFQIFNKAGESGDLTIMEFRLLEALVLSPDSILSREQLLDKARMDGTAVFDRAVDIQITRIRKKIGDDPKSPGIIRTVRGVGYVLICKTEIQSET